MTIISNITLRILKFTILHIKKNTITGRQVSRPVIILFKEEFFINSEKLLEDHYDNEFQLKPYVRETLEKMNRRDIKMCVATATEDRLAMSVLKRLKIDHYFEFLQTCNSTGLQKGNSKFFEIATQRLNEDTKDIWVFEDAYHCIESAKSINLNVVAIEDKSAKKDRDKIKRTADIYIESFKELNLDKL